MKQKTVRRVHHRHTAVRTRRTQTDGTYLVMVRGWMFIVMFAIMLGVGAIVGNFVNQQLNAAPQVAGVQTQR
ncbi:hypothetical protein M1555_03070 [Patescibacteria group bacterium]|nr:hypothetical protein [Patescibacteria group bacterium]